MAALRSGDDEITRTGYAWSSLALLDTQEREREMREQLESVLALETGERLEALREMIAAEYRMDAERLRAFTASRLRVWLAMADRDSEAVSQIARDYDTVFDSLAAAFAMRRTQAEQHALRSELSHQDVRPLARVLPSVATVLPTATAEPMPERLEESRPAPRWKFWARTRSLE